MTTALTTTSAREVYSKIESQMAAVEQLGKFFHQSGIMKLNTPGDGVVVALTCLCENMTPLEFARTYHIIEGKPSMRADMMAAKFRQAGGRIVIEKDGDDLQEAAATFEFDGQSRRFSFTIEEARRLMGKDENGKDKIDNTKGNWFRSRGAMLWSRLVTKAIRKIAPEIVAGVYTPEELEDSVVVAETKITNRAARRKELESGSEAGAGTVTAVDDSPAAVVHAPEPEVIDAVVESAAADTGLPDDGEPVTNEILEDLAAVGGPAGLNMTIKQMKDIICSILGPDGKPLEKASQATKGQIRSLTNEWRAKLAEQNGQS